MANEANIISYPQGAWITLQFAAANLASGTTTKLAMSTIVAPTNPGYVVPTGTKFVPVVLTGQLTAAGSAGSLVLNVTDDGTAITIGPAPSFGTAATASASDEPNDVTSIPAGSVVGVNAVASATWDGTSSDLDATLLGVLLPA